MHAEHIQHNNDERTQFFRKIYLLLYLKGLCVKGSWTQNKDCNILAPELFWLPQPLFPGLLNRGPGGPASAGTWFSFQHLLSNCSGLPVAGVI